MRISKRDAKLLLMLLGIVVFLATYLLVYNRYLEKTAAVTAQIAELKPTLDTLEEYYVNLSTYEAAIEEAKAAVKKEMEHYPSEILTEEQVLYGRELESKVGIVVNGMAFTEPVLVNEFYGIVPDSEEETAILMDAYQVSNSVTCDLTYAQLKSMLNYIYATKERTGVTDLSVSYDAESTALTGTVDVAKYYIAYEGAPERTDRTPIVATGQTNLFG